MHWLTTERARLGVLVANNMLLYVTGGAAGSEIRAGQVSCATPIAGAIASCGARTEWAPTGGLGVEAMFTPHWSAKVEWLYTGFGTHPFYTVMIPVNVKEDNVNIIRAGSLELNRHGKAGCSRAVVGCVERGCDRQNGAACGHHPMRDRRMASSRCRSWFISSSARTSSKRDQDRLNGDAQAALAALGAFSRASAARISDRRCCT